MRTTLQPPNITLPEEALQRPTAAHSCKIAHPKSSAPE